jgi:hypothetical protein
MKPKPKHLEPVYAATFKGKSVVDAYRFRPSHSAEAYIESFHSRNGFSRQRMAPEMADAFDTAVHALVTQSYPDGIFEVQS